MWGANIRNNYIHIYRAHERQFFSIGYVEVMQTFLPYRDFKKTARSLDRQRLGKQRVETYQLLRALNGETKGWVNHPAARMWSGHEKTLVVYGTVICAEWKSRGYVDNMQARIGEYFYKFSPIPRSTRHRGLVTVDSTSAINRISFESSPSTTARSSQVYPMTWSTCGQLLISMRISTKPLQH
jgi:hypothetical protein